VYDSLSFAVNELHGTSLKKIFLQPYEVLLLSQSSAETYTVSVTIGLGYLQSLPVNGTGPVK
jgi:hypothetical protein